MSIFGIIFVCCDKLWHRATSALLYTKGLYGTVRISDLFQCYERKNMYKIVSETSIEKLTEKVRALLAHPDNWFECGGLAVQCTNEGNRYFQAMVRSSVTPLMEDLKSKVCGEHAKILIEVGADVNACDRQGITPLMFASAFSETELVKILLSKKADVHAKDEEGHTPLFWAVTHSDNVENVQVLIKSGADVNAVNSAGLTVLMSALNNNDDIGIIRCLIDNGADVNAKYDGYELKNVTPLMMALECKHAYATIKRLLNTGADVNAQDSHGKTPWIYADLADCNTKIMELLKEYGAIVKRFRGGSYVSSLYKGKTNRF